MTNQDIKQQLLRDCKLQLSERRKGIQAILDTIAISLKEETKSSAGDKHETGRAMLQLERENAGKQLAEVEKLEAILTRIPETISQDPAHLGSVVMTSQANYFLSIPCGSLSVDSTEFYAIGITSPIGQLLLGKMEGDEVRFRESVFKVLSIF